MTRLRDQALQQTDQAQEAVTLQKIAAAFRHWGSVGDFPSVYAGKGLSDEFREATRDAMTLACANWPLLRKSRDMFNLVEHLWPAFYALEGSANRVSRGRDPAGEFLWWPALTHSPLDLEAKWGGKAKLLPGSEEESLGKLFAARCDACSDTEPSAGWRALVMERVPHLPDDSRDAAVSFPDELERWADATETEQRAAAVSAVASGKHSHSEDFTSCVWKGVPYQFNKTQAACIDKLWKAWEAGTPTLSQLTIGNRIGSSDDNFRLNKVFRDHPAWGVMIKPAGKGIYQLA